MEWEHKKIKIEVRNDGRFEFDFKGTKYNEESLRDAQHQIDVLTKDYYNFTKMDVTNMLVKLNDRERELVNDMIEELKNHVNSAYCEIGVELDWECQMIFDSEE